MTKKSFLLILRYLASRFPMLLLLQLVTQIVFIAATHNSSAVNAEIYLLVRENKQIPIKLSVKTDFEHESTDLIANVLYRRLSGLQKSMIPNGANAANVLWIRNQSRHWYIEEQRYGEDLIIGGLIKNDPQTIEAGFKMFDWGFAHQVDDGSFFRTGDRFHSTSFFVQAVAHTLLVIQQSPYSEKYAAQVAKYKPLVHRAARWMISPNIWEKGIKRNKPYTHRRYLVAAALALTGKLTGDEELIKYAHKSLEDGLSLQRPDGVNPEKGGHDSGYQTVGIMYAQRWVTYFPNDSLTSKVVQMIDKSLSWEKTRILPSGEISSEGNTRTGQQERIRDGSRYKKVGPGSQIRTFAYWASVTGNQKWEESARKIARFYYKTP
ncbi:hypothetical protein FD723_27640 [Nostoc sp. C052]|uniref:hypothetical protein n=1 Tax=Nostoc sp. C052 TaxID=2576902 RepID=UPI0015C35967|nr:hypothetical protein [Nostoc sp. C052]QLE43841.1 hypothetical protein FD723_27640 [Nostoc sp. C052]